MAGPLLTRAIPRSTYAPCVARRCRAPEFRTVYGHFLSALWWTRRTGGARRRARVLPMPDLRPGLDDAHLGAGRPWIGAGATRSAGSHRRRFAGDARSAHRLD